MNLQPAITNLLANRRHNGPQHVNRISQLDDKCLRRLFYSRTAWDKKAETSDGLQGVFETGNVLEPVIGRIVSELGEAANPQFRVVGTQLTTNDDLLKRYQISGTIDGLLQIHNGQGWETAGVIDIKTSSPNVFASLNGYDSLSRYPWTQKYRGQLMLYALAHNLERCFILFVNKTNLYDMKMMEFPLDFQYAEGLLKKAEQVNVAVEFGEAPAKINDPDECPKCPFAAICKPEYSTGGNLEISDNEELEEILTRLQELEPTAEEIGDLEKRRDQILTKGQDIAVGRFLILWKKIEGTRKPSPGGPYEQWRKKIVCQDN